MFSVYVKIDSRRCIYDVNSSAFIADPSGWVIIDEGEGDRFHHAQSNYFPLPVKTDEGVMRYKLTEEDRAVERTPEEMAADLQPAEDPPPTLEERVEALEAATLDLILGGIE